MDKVGQVHGLGLIEHGVRQCKFGFDFQRWLAFSGGDYGAEITGVESGVALQDGVHSVDVGQEYLNIAIHEIAERVFTLQENDGEFVLKELAKIRRAAALAKDLGAPFG